MKKLIVLFVGIIVLGNITFGQLPDGVIAPDWTLTDINGTTHTLYDYLNQGKVVFIDVSATWCGPCWSYHNSHALKDLYTSYGPTGTDEVMVFFIEGDGSTTLDDLHGTGSSTTGDWVTGTPYPIINSTSINGAYDIGYFPTVYMICPDRVIKEVGQMTTSALYTESQTCPDLTTNLLNTKIFRYIEPDGDYCDGSVRPRVEIQNYGTSDIISLDIYSILDGNPVDTFNWTGFLPMYEVDLIVLDELDAVSNGNHTFEIRTENPNGSTDEDTSNDQESGTFSTNSLGTYAKVKIKTDDNPVQTSWEIVAGSTIIASGGNYDTENFINIEDVCLYEDSCYTLIVYDSGNNGLSGSSFGLVMWNGSTIASFPASSFNNDSIHLDFCLGNNNGIESVSPNSEQVLVYPNPANDLVTFYAESFQKNEIYTFQLIDILGKVIEQKNVSVENNMIKMSIGDIKSGIYNVLITNKNTKVYNCKLIIN